MTPRAAPDAGYTLTEMLAALIMIGLTVGGLTEGVHVIGQIQSQSARAIAEGRALRAAQTGLERLVTGQGPFATDGGVAFDGTTAGFSFACGASATCRAAVSGFAPPFAVTITDETGVKSSIALPVSITEVRFVYGGSSGDVTPTWPPTSTLGRQSLQWVALRGTSRGSPMPIAAAHVWKDQPRDCVYDAIAQACRNTAP